jgi:nitrate/nitrite-specific signal transduction histidine kinase
LNLYKISFRAKYIFALILIAVFAILVYSSTLFLVKDQGKYARCINISGKERMLVVKMLNYVNNLSHNYTQNYKKALEETIIEFEEIELTLKNKGYYFAQQNKKEYISYIK